MKNTTPKLMILSTALAGVMALGTSAFAQPGGGPGCDGSGPGGGRGGGPGGQGGKGPGAMMMRMFNGLDLTEAQEVQLVRIRRELRAEREAMQATRQADRAAMQAELSKDTPDAAVLHQLADKRLEHQRAKSHAMIDKMLAFRATLSPEQKAQLTKKMENFKARAGKRGGGRFQR